MFCEWDETWDEMKPNDWAEKGKSVTGDNSTISETIPVTFQ